MLLFEHKKHLQSYDAQSSMQREILSFTELMIDQTFKVNILYHVKEVQMKKSLKDKILSIIHNNTWLNNLLSDNNKTKWMWSSVVDEMLKHFLNLEGFL